MFNDLSFSYAAIGNFGNAEMLLVLAFVLILFGPKKLPSLARAIGKSVREFKDGIKGFTSELEDEVDKPAAPRPRSGDLDPRPRKTLTLPPDTISVASSPSVETVVETAPAVTQMDDSAVPNS